MPRIAFKGLWDDIQTKGFWTGTVKNLRKDGKYYWVEAFIEPIFDENGKKIDTIRTKIKEGWTNKEIYKFLTDRYGDFVL